MAYASVLRAEVPPQPSLLGGFSMGTGLSILKLLISGRAMTLFLCGSCHRRSVRASFSGGRAVKGSTGQILCNILARKISRLMTTQSNAQYLYWWPLHEPHNGDAASLGTIETPMVQYHYPFFLAPISKEKDAFLDSIG